MGIEPTTIAFTVAHSCPMKASTAILNTYKKHMLIHNVHTFYSKLVVIHCVFFQVPLKILFIKFNIK